jgi:hypothetical protein
MNPNRVFIAWDACVKDWPKRAGLAARLQEKFCRARQDDLTGRNTAPPGEPIILNAGMARHVMPG